MLNKIFKLFEFFILFVLLPILFFYEFLPLFFIVPTLWIVSLYIYFIFKKSNENAFLFERIDKFELLFVLIRFLLIGSLLIAFTYYYFEDKFFVFLFDKPLLFLALLIFYPILSVIPQELIYRRFFLFRYERRLSKISMILINGLIFGFAHILFVNYIAIGFSAIGGALFISTYQRTKSFSLVCLEHSLYGNLIFIVGLGDYFYHNGNI